MEFCNPYHFYKDINVTLNVTLNPFPFTITSGKQCPAIQLFYAAENPNVGPAAAAACRGDCTSLPEPLKIFACGEGCATVPVAYRSLRSSCFFSCFRPAFSSSMSSIIFVFSLAAAQVCISLPPCRSRLCCWYAFRANRNSTHYLRNLRPSSCESLRDSQALIICGRSRPKSCDFFASLRNPKPVRDFLWKCGL